MKIKFNQVIYTLIDAPNIHGTHFQATIDKTDLSVDALLEDLDAGTSTITVYDDEDNVTGIYTGYDERVAIGIGDHISIEFENTNVEEMIINLQSQIAAVEQSTRSIGILEVRFPNVSSLPKTVYDDAILASMSVISKSVSNENAVLDDFEATITDGSVTISGVVSETTDIVLYLTNSL